MSDLGKAIYMAASVFLFIVAATTSIYVYSSLNSYLELMTKNTVNITNRAEVEIIDGTKKTRDELRRICDVSENYIYRVVKER